MINFYPYKKLHFFSNSAIVSQLYLITLVVQEDGILEYSHFNLLKSCNGMDVKDTPSSTSLLKRGLNAILIPVDIFTNTKLHELIENQDLSGTPLQTNETAGRIVNLGGMDKDNETIESVNAWVEAVFSVHGVTAVDAEEILSYVVQNASGSDRYTVKRVKPETLGIHEEVLRLIPMQSVTNSPTGPMPSLLWQRILTAIVEGFWLLVGLLCAIVNFLIHLVQIIVNWGLTVVVPLLAQVALLILQAIILVLSFILLALALIESIILFFSLSLMLLFIGRNTSWGANISSNGFSIFVESDLQEQHFKFETEVLWLPVSILRMSLPFLKQNFYFTDEKIFEELDPLLIPPDEISESASALSNISPQISSSSSIIPTPTLDEEILNDFNKTLWSKLHDFRVMLPAFGFFTAIVLGSLAIFSSGFSLAGLGVGMAGLIILGSILASFQTLFGPLIGTTWFLFMIISIISFGFLTFIDLVFSTVFGNWKNNDETSKTLREIFLIPDYIEMMKKGTKLISLSSIIKIFAAASVFSIIGAILGVFGISFDILGLEGSNYFLQVLIAIVLLIAYLIPFAVSSFIAYNTLWLKSEESSINTFRFVLLAFFIISTIFFGISIAQACYPLTIEIIDEKEKTSIEGACVNVVNYDQVFYDSGNYYYPEENRNTSSEGITQFGAQDGQKYVITIQKTGYEHKVLTIESLTGLNIYQLVELTPYYNVSVNVTDPSGDPIEGIPVHIKCLGDRNGNMDTWDTGYTYDEDSTPDGWANFTYLYNDPSQRDALPFNHTFEIYSNSTSLYQSGSVTFNLTENGMNVIDLVLEPKTLNNLTVKLVDPRGDLIQPLEDLDYEDFYQYLSIDLSRFISPSYVPMGCREPDPSNNYLLTWTNLPYDTDYKLDYEQLEFGWYAGNIFRYYLTTELTSIEVSREIYKEFELTPASNNFPILLIDEANQPVKGAKVTIHRVENYQGDPDSMVVEDTLNEFEDGIYWFNGLEYDHTWYFDVEHPSYENIYNRPLMYVHNRNYVNDIKITLELV